MIQQVLFVLIAGASLGYAALQFLKIRRNIKLGKDESISGDSAERWRNVLLVALGQKKMFSRMIPAVLHLFIYVAFVITQVELLEIFVDGITGQHRVFWPPLGGFYTFVISFIEILSVLALAATIIFLARRNILRLARFHKPEMKGWPFKDANYILFLELALIFFIFLMNSADMTRHQNEYGFVVSQFLSPIWDGTGEGTLHLLERIGWWGHILVVFAFLNYLPFSKHLHIILAFPNTYFARLQPRGEMDNMPEVMNEVKNMLGLPVENAGTEVNMDNLEFGANDVFSLSWKNVLDAYSCTECGRCTSVCPANLTGKKLSPRKIVMDIRDRADEIGKKLDSKDVQYAKDKSQALSATNFDDGRSLFDYISREEIHACTTCNACVEACPVLISPLEPILKLRRYEILSLSEGPSEWLPMFNSLENNGAVWAMSVEREAWKQEL
ncbi:MAG: (Fe-S)-binding protein [Haliscomenobacter sp.]|uniref:(Fe-S)-binding protein n=1 Tax=Haliscomenobacter sp. TaxID=2717303 RepID=UPI0029B773DA|nr:(Fe-S)-binding protein [Haliscomenobacter sp.]MDX2070699.1 (Fe-S)-binding protein [Haliscomenobacter sp.]